MYRPLERRLESRLTRRWKTKRECNGEQKRLAGLTKAERCFNVAYVSQRRWVAYTLITEFWRLIYGMCPRIPPPIHRWYRIIIAKYLDVLIVPLNLRSIGRGFNSTRTKLRNNLGQVVHTYVPLSPSSITWSKDGDVLRLKRWRQAWRKVMAAYRRGWLNKSPAGSARGPTLDKEYGRSLPFTVYCMC